MYHISETNKTFILNKLYYEIYDKYEQNETYIEASTAEPETYAWLLEDAVHIFVKLFHDREKFRPLNSTLAAIPWGDVRSSSPLPTGVNSFVTVMQFLLLFQVELRHSILH